MRMRLMMIWMRKTQECQIDVRKSKKKKGKRKRKAAASASNHVEEADEVMPQRKVRTFRAKASKSTLKASSNCQ